MNNRVIVYTTTTCPYCKIAKDYLIEKNIVFKEIDVSSNEARQLEMEKKSGQMGVPVIDVNGTMVVGFDKPRIAALIGAN